ncbi:MAG: alpha-galactosidase [Lachnospiraceae bacterium]|nr:alpha-galactosidase [Lachnospiraceae bacterium]
MSIIIDQKEKLFTIHTAQSTYQMTVGKFGHLIHLYYGKKTEGDMRYLLTYGDRGFSGNPYEAERDRTYSLDALPQEYPCYGTGDYRNVALHVKNPDGTYSCDLRYQSARVVEGKYSLPGLPAVHTEAGAETLEVVLADRQSGLEVTLLYGVLADSDVITRAARIRNTGSETPYLEKAASCCLDFLYGAYDLIHFHGRHGMERQFERSSLLHADQVLQSRRGVSSHQQNPFFILADHRTGEESGECYGFSLLYSGGFKAEAAVDQYQQTRAVMGLSDEFFSWPLQQGEIFHTPEAVVCYSARGFSELSFQYHQLIRYHVCRGEWQTKRRPILINSWEAAYFDFDGEKIVEIARQASELGVEMLVLDDGWFGKRDDDFAGLGDWAANEKKLGCTLGEIGTRINALGLKFGLWIEPEMVSEDSDLYRKHPDWAFVIPGRKPVRGRYQLVLDFSRKEVVDCIFEQVAAAIEQANVEYIKMDMNRHLSDIYSHTAVFQNQGVILHKYVLGVYDFLERLLQKFPKLLIEGCAGGGGRFDAGMLYYTPQIWCSDNSDAVERIRIQYGTSFGYPIATVGSHVSAVPNHQTGRSTNIVTRGVVAMAGSFGYELDLKLITPEEKAIVRQQIQDYKKYFDLIQNGRYWRLTSPFEDEDYAAWEFTAQDGSEVLLNVVTLAAHFNGPSLYVRLRGLEEDAVYRMEETGAEYPGSALMYAGVPIPKMTDDYQAWQVHFVRK